MRVVQHAVTFEAPFAADHATLQQSWRWPAALSPEEIAGSGATVFGVSDSKKQCPEHA